MFYIYPIDKSCQSCYSFPCQQGLYPPGHSQAGGKSYLWPVTRSPRRSRVSPFEGLGLRFRQEESESRTFKIGGVFILWMVAKSCTTKRMVETRWNPINSGINHLPVTPQCALILVHFQQLLIIVTTLIKSKKNPWTSKDFSTLSYFPHPLSSDAGLPLFFDQLWIDAVNGSHI